MAGPAVAGKDGPVRDVAGPAVAGKDGPVRAIDGLVKMSQ